MWRDSLRRIPPIGIFLVVIRGAGPSRERPHASWLRQVESYLMDVGMAGLASAQDGAQTESEGVSSEVDAVTRCCGVCPHT